MTVKKSFSRIGFALVVVILAASVLQVLLSGVLLTVGDVPSWVGWIATFAPIYVVAIPLGVLVLKKLPAEQLERVSISVGKFLKIFAVCVTFFYVGNLIGTLLSQVFSGGQAENPLFDFVFDNSPIRLLVLPILAPVIEEFLFRKQIIDRTVKYGEKTAIVFSAVVFALFHMNLFQFFYALGLGLVFGYVYTKTGKLRYSILLHCIVNFLGSIFAPWLLQKAGISAEGTMNAAELAGNPWTVVYGAYAVLLVVVAVIGLVILIRNRGKIVFEPREEELPREGRIRTVYVNPGFLLFFLLCLASIVISLAGVHLA